jgi:DNA-binding MarR family transcriptional regulator/N-acetylglutamate synthase-like GNAT family acetyltransferase
MTGPTIAPARAAGPTPAQVAQVRAFNRFYTNVIGALHDMYLDTPYTLTESRLLFEVARHGTAGVPALRQALDIDAGYLSRVLSRFEADGLVTRHRSAADARRQEIRVTEAGRAAVAELDARAATQIGGLLGGVDCAPLLGAMRVITEALGQQQPPASDGGRAERAVTLRPLAGGDLGWILQRHGTMYAAEFGWDASFEGFCAQIVAEYVTWRDRYPGRTQGWIAEVDGVAAGSVCCVPDSETTARLRLLIVEPWARGLGLGARLVGQCLDFARQAGYADIVLLTYGKLAAARRVYQAAGFTLESEHTEEAFGQQLTSQSWSREL